MLRMNAPSFCNSRATAPYPRSIRIAPQEIHRRPLHHHVHLHHPLQSPSWLNSARQSSTLDAMSTSATFATTPSARSTHSLSRKGTKFFQLVATQTPYTSANLYQDLIRHVHRQALRYLIRNTTLPQRVRAQAQLQLSQMHCYTRYTQIKNRCIMGGKGRGVFSDFRLGRVSRCSLPMQIAELVSCDSTGPYHSTFRARSEADISFSQYQFRLNALSGNLPGVRKASW